MQVRVLSGAPVVRVGFEFAEKSAKMRSTVGVAQLVRVPDCDSGCRGFESHHPPQFRYNIGLSFRSVIFPSPACGRRCRRRMRGSSREMPSPLSSLPQAGEGSERRAMRDSVVCFAAGPLAQLVEQETLNLLVEGSTPSRPTNLSTDMSVTSVPLGSGLGRGA